MTTRGSISETRSSMNAKVSPLSASFDSQIAVMCDGASGSLRSRPAMEPEDLVWTGAKRLLERADLPLRVRRDLYTLNRQSRRVAVNRSAFGFLVRTAWEYANDPTDAVWLPRVIEAETLGRKHFPVLPSMLANRAETDANGGLDFCQINHKDLKTPGTLDDLLAASLVQEFATKQLAASEATEMRVRSVLMGR